MGPYLATSRKLMTVATHNAIIEMMLRAAPIVIPLGFQMLCLHRQMDRIEAELKRFNAKMDSDFAKIDERFNAMNAKIDTFNAKLEK